MAPLVQQLLFGGVLAVSVGGCAKNAPGTTTPSGPVQFGTEQSKVGAGEVGDYAVTLDLTHGFDGHQGPIVNTNIQRSARYRTQFVAVRDGLPIEADVTYLAGRDYVVDDGGTEDDETWVSGNTYLIRENGFQTNRGEAVRREEREALGRDFERMGGTGALQAQLRGKSLAVGDVVRLTPGEIMDRFPDARAQMLELRLVGVRSHCGRQIAVFDASTVVTSEFWGGVTDVALAGKAEFDVATARPVSFALEGTAVVFADHGSSPNGEGTGSFKAQFAAQSQRCR